MGTIPVALLLLVIIDMCLCGSVAKASARTADSWALGEQRQERRRDEEEKNPILSHLMLDAQHLISSKEKRVAVKDELRT